MPTRKCTNTTFFNRTEATNIIHNYTPQRFFSSIKIVHHRLFVPTTQEQLRRDRNIQQINFFNTKHYTNVKYIESLLVNISPSNILELKIYFKGIFIYLLNPSRAVGIDWTIFLILYSHSLLSSLWSDISLRGWYSATET